MNKISSTPKKDEFKSEPLRSPPQNIEAEQALLGAIMINNKAYDDVSDYLKKQHFSYSFYGKVFESASKLIEQGQNANPISLSTYLEKEPEIIEQKGFNLLTELANSTVINLQTIQNTEHQKFPGFYKFIVFIIFMMTGITG